MGKTLSLTIGIIAAFIGLVLLLSWWYEFLFVVRAVLPILLILGGVIAVLAGISELKDVLKSKKD